MLSAYNTASNQAASATAYRAAQSAANSGLSSGAQQGARQDVYNQAAAAQNSNMQNVLSPQGLANAYSAYQNAISNGMTSPYVSQLLQLQAGTPSFVSSGNGWSSLLGGLSSLAGAAGSLGWSPFSSAGGTGDTDTPNTYQPISESGYETSPEGYMYSTPNDYYAYGLGY
jgi:hypothetical protein